MITITFASWMIPALITIVGIVWALFFVEGGIFNSSADWFGATYNIIMLVPALAVSCIAWMIWGFLK